MTESQAALSTPSGEAFEHVADQLEQSGKVQFEPPGGADAQQDLELNEMRTISKRLKALDPATRTRVLAWLQAKFA